MEEEVSLRFLNSDDAEAISIIERDCFSNPWPTEAIRLELTRENSLCVGIFLGDEMVGYSVNYVVLDELHVLRIGVKQSMRRCGCAKRAIVCVLKEAFARGAKRAFLEVRKSNVIAQELYKHAGFSVVGERKEYYIDNSENAILMCCEMPSGNFNPIL